jgi:hypothetical protein
MHVECPACHHVLEFSAEAPAFCSRCGHAIADAKPATAIEYDPDAATLPPSESSGATLGSMPEIVGGYRLLRSLGSGGMGTVYEAEESSSGCRVALKLIAPEFAISKDAVERFRQEGRLASTIVHPRCVFVLAADEQAGQPYIAMELMPGTTLHDVVKERGPLAVGEAVAKIVDVVDGLQEVHRMGFVHRDIKPSNCFVERDGRVKIGDFGLCKSLVRDAHLTKTGSFLGTPLYASPEQIKMDRVDQQSDVYAVAATLYFLLTGRAPHQTGDPAATVARIVSDPAPPMRSLRKEIPAALERVVLRGLERDRKHRWKSVAELRTALSPFLRQHLSAGGLGIRIAAFVVDVVLVFLLGSGLLFLDMGGAGLQLLFGPRSGMLARAVTRDVLWIIYFTVLEGIWGSSFGKYWLRLRVCSAEDGARLGLAKALLRTLIFYGLAYPGWLIAELLRFQYFMIMFGSPSGLDVMLTYLPWFWFVVGTLLNSCTLRQRDGYRALHDFVSGSRLVQLAWLTRRKTWRKEAQETHVSRPEELPEQVGRFLITGAIRWTGKAGVLAAEDGPLRRKVWLWLRPQTAPALSEARRQAARRTRLRWLANGQTGDGQWDAFLAPATGCSLPKLIDRDKQLFWPEARPLLEQLTEELAAASGDGTVPDPLTLDHVWVQSDSRILLLDTPLEERMSQAADGMAKNVEQRALALLAAVAVFVLEGKPRSGARAQESIRAPVPEHAARLLDRLLGVTEPSERVTDFQAQIASSTNRPTHITRGLRVGHLVLQAPFLAVGLYLMLLTPALVATQASRLSDKAIVYTAVAVGWSVLWVAWAFLFRGGWALRMIGILLVDAKGCRASRSRCALRAFYFWLPAVAVQLAFVSFIWGSSHSASITFMAWLTTLCFIIVYLLLTLVNPRRGLHDELAGTYLVPK